MRHPTAVIALFLAGALGATAAAAQEYGQVVFQNRTIVTGHLYIDGGYGCGPVLMNFYCATMARPEVHTAYVKFDDGEIIDFGEVEVVAGEALTLTVKEEED